MEKIRKRKLHPAAGSIARPIIEYPMRKLKLLNVKPFRQSPGFCGPASLKMVADYFGVKKSERAIGRLARCSAQHGTTGPNLILAARALGFSAQLVRHASFGDIHRFLRTNIPPIAGWFSTDDSHYSPVVGLDAQRIYLQDPELRRMRVMDREAFMRVWFDFDSDVPRHERDCILRRLIVLRPKERR